MLSNIDEKLTVNLEKAEADASTRANNGWRATVGTLKDASIEFTELNKVGDGAFGLLQGLWSSGDPCDVGISDAGGTLTLTCEVMNFNVNRNLEEDIFADVTLKPTQSGSGGGMNVAARLVERKNQFNEDSDLHNGFLDAFGVTRIVHQIIKSNSKCFSPSISIPQLCRQNPMPHLRGGEPYRRCFRLRDSVLRFLRTIDRFDARVLLLPTSEVRRDLVALSVLAIVLDRKLHDQCKAPCAACIPREPQSLAK